MKAKGSRLLDNSAVIRTTTETLLQCGRKLYVDIKPAHIKSFGVIL